MSTKHPRVKRLFACMNSCLDTLLFYPLMTGAQQMPRRLRSTVYLRSRPDQKLPVTFDSPQFQLSGVDACRGPGSHRVSPRCARQFQRRSACESQRVMCPVWRDATCDACNQRNAYVQREPGRCKRQRFDLQKDAARHMTSMQGRNVRHVQ